jgi:hypothetical protein
VLDAAPKASAGPPLILDTRAVTRLIGDRRWWSAGHVVHAPKCPPVRAWPASFVRSAPRLAIWARWPASSARDDRRRVEGAQMVNSQTPRSSRNAFGL